MDYLLVAKILQIIFAFVLIGLVLMQSKGTGLASSFGGTAQYRSRRGMEKVVHLGTLIVGISFVANSLTILFLG
ncbi:MAG: preprotein translocase subunit SecG [Patescibacteria group bacterium]